jgi:Tol biopolymer transport system component
LPATGGATLPFWSPDNRSVGFFSHGKLQKIDISGGLPQIICDAAAGGGGTWNSQGAILFSPTQSSGLYQVSSEGGESKAVTKLGPEAGGDRHRHPYFLPDGRHFLYFATNNIYIGSLGSGVTKKLLNADSKAEYAPPGYLLFIRQGVLLAQPFDYTREELTGEPVRIAEQVGFNTNNGAASFSVSGNDVLAYRTGDMLRRNLVWYSRDGKQLSSVGSTADYRGIDLSPDGNTVAAHIHEDSGLDLWLFDLLRGSKTPFTFNVAKHYADPLWSPDGKSILFDVIENGVDGLYIKSADQTRNEELLLELFSPDNPGGATDWAAHGKIVVFDDIGKGGTGGDIFYVRLNEDHKPQQFLATKFNEIQGKLSPDERWLAYASDEKGAYQIYVRSFPDARGEWQISINGGMQPRWRADGKELFYISADQYLMAVSITATPDKLIAETPKRLFKANFSQPNGVSETSAYAVNREGNKFLITETASSPSATPTPLTVIVNWTSSLKK